jgi:hypothetical protein
MRLFLILLAFCGSASAAALTPEKEMEIYALAYGQYGSRHGGIPMPPKPLMFAETPESICAALRKEPGCPWFGYFVDGVIRLSSALDFSTAVDRSKLVHEYVHYLQVQHGGPTTDCLTYLAREYEAYSIQIHVLEKAGEDHAARQVLFAASQVYCGDLP